MATYVRNVGSVVSLTSITAPTAISASSVNYTIYSSSNALYPNETYIFPNWKKANWKLWYQKTCKETNTAVKNHLSNCSKINNTACESTRASLKTLYNKSRSFTTLKALTKKTYTRHTNNLSGRKYSDKFTTSSVGSGRRYSDQIDPSSYAPLPTS